jgi:hypothetical protein
MDGFGDSASPPITHSTGSTTLKVPAIPSEYRLLTSRNNRINRFATTRKHDEERREVMAAHTPHPAPGLLVFRSPAG